MLLKCFKLYRITTVYRWYDMRIFPHTSMQITPFGNTAQ